MNAPERGRLKDKMRAMPQNRADELFAALRWSDQMTLTTNPQYAVKGLFDMGSTGLVVAAPNAGKTFWLLDLSAHIGTGRKYLGRRVRRMRVVYVCAEGAAWRIEHRILAWAKHHQVDQAELRIGVVALPINILNGDGEAVCELVRLVRSSLENEPVWVVLDTVTAAAPGGNLNGPEDSSRVTDVLKKLSNAAEGGAIAAHHTGKATPDSPAGHHNFSGQVDVVLAIVEQPDGTREVRNPKLRDGPRSEGIFFRLHPVNLGFDVEGDALDSCAVIPADAPATSGDEVVPADAFRALEILRKAGGGNNLKTEAWLDACRKAGLFREDATDETARKTLTRFANRLRNAGFLTPQSMRGFHGPAEAGSV